MRKVIVDASILKTAGEIKGNIFLTDATTAETVKLVGTDKAKIIDEASRLLDDSAAYAKLALSLPKGWRRQSTPTATGSRQSEL